VPSLQKRCATNVSIEHNKREGGGNEREGPINVKSERSLFIIVKHNKYPGIPRNHPFGVGVAYFVDFGPHHIIDGNGCIKVGWVIVTPFMAK